MVIFDHIFCDFDLYCQQKIRSYALFMANVVGLASCAQQTSAAELGELSTDDDEYGYGPDTDGTQEAVSIASHQENAVKIEVMHYLDNPSKNFLVC